MTNASVEAGSLVDKVTSAADTGVRVAIPLGIALIIGVFVSLGIQGDVFTRLVRNNPYAVATALALAVVGVSLPVAAFRAAQWRRTASLLGAALLVAATGIALVASVRGIGLREQPLVQLAPNGPSSQQQISLMASATGVSLRTDDHLLLRVTAYPTTVSPADAQSDCADTSAIGPKTPGAALLYWGEAGPNSTGSVTSSASLSVSRSTYGWVCAHAVLSQRDPSARDTRFTSLLVRAGALTAAPN